VWTLQRKRSNRDRFIVPVLALVVSAYFAHHSVDGRYGSDARVTIDAALVEAQARLIVLRDMRAGLEHKVALLKSGSIERDTLDEHAREAFGLISANEILYMQ
jgi:cell division protein FtsB